MKRPPGLEIVVEGRIMGVFLPDGRLVAYAFITGNLDDLRAPGMDAFLIDGTPIDLDDTITPLRAA